MSTDPDLQAPWRQLHQAIAAELRPYVQDHLLEELATRIVADHVAAAGWRPPLAPMPDVVAQARAAGARTALTPREDR